MARPAKAVEPARPVKVEILRDGVFIGDDVRADKGDQPEVDPDIAKLLTDKGLARVL